MVNEIELSSEELTPSQLDLLGFYDFSDRKFISVQGNLTRLLFTYFANMLAGREPLGLAKSEELLAAYKLRGSCSVAKNAGNECLAYTAKPTIINKVNDLSQNFKPQTVKSDIGVIRVILSALKPSIYARSSIIEGIVDLVKSAKLDKANEIMWLDKMANSKNLITKQISAVKIFEDITNRDIFNDSWYQINGVRSEKLKIPNLQ